MAGFKEKLGNAAGSVKDKVSHAAGELKESAGSMAAFSAVGGLFGGPVGAGIGAATGFVTDRIDTITGRNKSKAGAEPKDLQDMTPADVKTGIDQLEQHANGQPIDSKIAEEAKAATASVRDQVKATEATEQTAAPTTRSPELVGAKSASKEL